MRTLIVAVVAALALVPAARADWEVVRGKDATGAETVVIKQMSVESEGYSINKVGLVLTCGKESGIGMMLWIPDHVIPQEQTIFVRIDEHDTAFQFPVADSTGTDNPTFVIEPRFLHALKQGNIARFGFPGAGGEPRIATFDLKGFTAASRSLPCATVPDGS